MIEAITGVKGIRPGLIKATTADELAPGDKPPLEPRPQKSTRPQILQLKRRQLRSE